MNKPEFVTFGCRLNAFESELMRERAAEAGADNTVIFNTCAVTAEAVRQARQQIRRARRENPDARLVVTGCAAQVETARFADMDEVDLVLGNEEKLSARSYGRGMNERLRVNDIMAVRETAPQMIDGFDGRTRAFVQIQTGCDHRCTFCIIPYARGNSRSVPPARVIDQIETFVERGYREVVLTGVDLTSYGPDLAAEDGNRPTLGRLCREILERVPKLGRLRLSSIDSIEVDETLFDLLAHEPRLMPHLHLSLQSGDDMILKRMKRRHTAAQAVDFCSRLRAARPEITFGADFIAGFPTETEAMFENTLAHVEDCGLSFLHVFPYSRRPGTPAERMPQLPVSTRKDRARRLREAGRRARRRLFDSLVGSTSRVLIEQSRDGTATGHSDQFAPVALAAERAENTVVPVRFTGHDGKRLNGVPLT